MNKESQNISTQSISRWLILAFVVILLDQFTKWMVLNNLQTGETIYVAPFFNWVLAHNSGAAFSFLADAGGWQRWFFTVLALGVSLWIIVMLKQHRGENRISLALSLILSGAIGNVIDRVRFGAVVDFIQWHVNGFYWPAFNIADAAIFIGASLMILDAVLRGKAENAQKQKS